jgi:hypothetical protein
LVFVRPKAHTAYQEASMTSITSRAAVVSAAAAAMMSVVWGVFVPYGYPWPTIGWALLAGAFAAWVGIGSIRLTPRMSDVIGDVEAEPSRAAAAPERGVVSSSTAS